MKLHLKGSEGRNPGFINRSYIVLIPTHHVAVISDDNAGRIPTGTLVIKVVSCTSWTSETAQ